MLNYEIVKKDLFTVDDKYSLVQCISADFAMGAGIAMQFNDRYDMKRRLTDKYGDWMTRWDNYPEERGVCIKEGKVFNLVTKKVYWQKPTYETMQRAIDSLCICAKNARVTELAMPMIGCGLDRLVWDKVSEIIQRRFMNEDFNILVCTLHDLT